MPVKARDDVTLANVNDVTASIRYYQLKASTASAPTAPTVYPAPSPWVTAEPSYSDGATNSLYTVDVTVFSDGSFDYSTVSLSSSYEAAKAAWNKAQSAQLAAGQAYQAAVTAQKSAGTAQTAADNATALASTAQNTANIALKNAQEFIRNPTMRSDVSNPDGWPGTVALGASGAPSTPPTPFTTYAKVTSRDHVASWTLPNIPGRVLQYTIYAVADSTATTRLQFGVQYCDTGSQMHWDTALQVTVGQGQSGWAKYIGTWTVPDNIGSGNSSKPWLQLNTYASDSGWYVTGLSIKDVTEVASAQSMAYKAQTIASAAQSAASAAQSSADAAQAAASAAQTTADGKNKVVRSTSAPSSTSGYSAGDQWWVYSGETVTALYLYSGTAWVSQTLTNSVIANLDAGKITSGYVNADRIQAGSITGAKVAAGTITASNMVAGTLTAASGIIADAAISSAQIVDGSIGTAEIADAAISTAKIADASITNAKIANLDAGKITSGYVDAARIQAGTIDADKLAADSVTSDKIVANAVTSEKLVSEAVTADKLAANSVTAVKLAANSVTADKADIGSLTAAIVSSGLFKTTDGHYGFDSTNGFWAGDTSGLHIALTETSSGVSELAIMHGADVISALRFIDTVSTDGYVHTGIYTGDNGQFLEFATLVDSVNHPPDNLSYDVKLVAAQGTGRMLIEAQHAVNISGTWFARSVDDLPSSPNVVGGAGTRAVVGGVDYVFDGAGRWSATSHRIFTGSKVIIGTGASEYTFMSKTEWNSIVGRKPVAGDVITFTNGDRGAALFSSAFGAIDTNDGHINVVFPGNISVPVRLNYCIICND